MLFISGTFGRIDATSTLGRIASVFPVWHLNKLLEGVFNPNTTGTGVVGSHVAVLAAWGVGALDRRRPAIPLGAAHEMTGADATDDALMQLALDEARAALAHDDVPVGAVVARRADGDGARPAAQRARAHRRPDRARRAPRAARRGRGRSAAGGSTTASSSSRSNRARCAPARS